MTKTAKLCSPLCVRLALAALAGLLAACDAGGPHSAPVDLPTCSASAVNGAVCEGDPQQLCMSCSAGTLYACGCVDAGLSDANGSGLQWLCVGEEQGCQ
jgi:hypothetical protein